MLDKVREHSRSFVTYVIVGGIIFIFVAYFGPGSQSCASPAGSVGYAAQVNGAPISVAVFEQAYGNEYRLFQQRGGGAFSAEMAEQMRLRENVLEGLITRELHAQAARQMGIAVSDPELADEIHGRPEFQKDGRFDLDLYRRLLQYLATTPGLYEAELRKDLLVRKFRASVQATAKVSDDEIHAEFVRDNEKINLEYVRFAPAHFRAEASAATDEEAKGFAEKSPEKVADFYARNEYRYNRAPRAQVRQILARVAEDAPAAEVDTARKKIDAARAELDQGTQFALVAAKQSDDESSRGRGGDLGEVTPGIRGRDFDDAVKATEAGKLSAVFRDPTGFHVLKIEEKFPEERKTVKDVEIEIARELLKDDKAKDAARRAAEAALAKLRKGASLSALYPAGAKKEGESVVGGDTGNRPAVAETGDFSPSGDFVPTVGVAQELVLAAFAVDSGKSKHVDRVLEVNNAFYVASVKSRTHADVSQLDLKRVEQRERARRRKADEFLEAFTKHLKDQARIDRNAALLAPRRGAAAGGEG